MTQQALQFCHVSARRGLETVLRDIHFSVKGGESVAILGPNGSGKSTLIKTITREIYPEAGTLKIYGRETWDVFELRSQMGIVTNDLQAIFAQELTGLEVVLSGFFTSVGLWRNNHVTPVMVQKSEQTLKKLGVLHLKDHLMSEISSGEARRILIGRALVHSPETLIFDEPSNSLDLAAQHTLRAAIRQLAKAKHGIVLATHHLPDIVPEIKRVILLREGKVFADGPKEKMLTASKLSAVFGSPVQVLERDDLYHAF